jgi:predicted dehydrogenase
VTIRFFSGASARCVASVSAGCPGGKFTIHGSSGTVGLPWMFKTAAATQLSRAIKDLNDSLPDTRPESSSLISRGSRFIGRRLGVRPKPTLTPHARFYQEIAKNVQQGNPLPVCPAEALLAMEVCCAAYESAITGSEVALPLNPTSAVYSGISKGLYDSRKCARNAVPRRASSAFVQNKKNTNVARVGLIGLDTTHALSFTSILHDTNNPFHIPGAQVVAAYPGGSPDMPISISRVNGFTGELNNSFCVPIVDTPEDVAEACDLIFILASDGRTHPPLFRKVASYGKPVFLDKPIAVSASEADEIFAIAKETRTRVFASSAFRYADALVEALVSIRANRESIRACTIKYWLQIQETQGRYFWYGIHAAEILLAVMGRGVRAVQATSNEDHDTILVLHDDGRESAMHGSTTDGTFHVTIETEQRQLQIDLSSSMPSLSARTLWAALDVLTNGSYPRLWSSTWAGSVSGPRPGRTFDPEPAETMEIVRLLDAAQSSHTLQRRVVV